MSSVSTLSISSGSSIGSLGSLGSLSEGSHGSLSSLGIDMYSPHISTDSGLQDLHRRVEKLLQGHTISPIQENPLTVSPDLMREATGGYLESVMASSNLDINLSVSATMASAVGSVPVVTSSVLSSTVSPHSSLSSLSPPISPYDVGPPPTYVQHMNVNVPKPPSAAPQRQVPLPNQFSNSVISPLISPYVPPINSNQSKVIIDSIYGQQSWKAETRTNNSGILNPNSYLGLHSQTVDVIPESVNGFNVTKRSQYPENLDIMSNPPLSPISESSSGVCNNLSGGNTRSVSAAVSDESVAGDSGVFEAVVKRYVMKINLSQMTNFRLSPNW